MKHRTKGNPAPLRIHILYFIQKSHKDTNNSSSNPLSKFDLSQLFINMSKATVLSTVYLITLNQSLSDRHNLIANDAGDSSKVDGIITHNWISGYWLTKMWNTRNWLGITPSLTLWWQCGNMSLSNGFPLRAAYGRPCTHKEVRLNQYVNEPIDIVHSSRQ